MEYYEFSYDEKIAIVCALQGLMAADDSVDEEETLVISRLSLQFGISADEMMNAALNMPVEQCVSILKAMTLQKKAEFAFMMGKMAMADGYIQKEEKEFIAFIKKICNL